jgi:VIT1/CCC1 family predicted Fe2+/Mn2+ transporter
VITLTAGLALVAVFSTYLAVVKDQRFRTLFGRMAAIGLGVALSSFLVGVAVRVFLGVEI